MVVGFARSESTKCGIGTRLYNDNCCVLFSLKIGVRRTVKKLTDMEVEGYCCGTFEISQSAKTYSFRRYAQPPVVTRKHLSNSQSSYLVDQRQHVALSTGVQQDKLSATCSLFSLSKSTSPAPGSVEFTTLVRPAERQSTGPLAGPRT